MARMTSSRAPDTRASLWRMLILLGSMAFLGAFAGLLGASGRPEIVAIFLGLVIAGLIISSRVALFWFVVIGALVVTGLAQLYLPGSRYVRYVVPLASLALLMHWVMDHFTAPRRGEPEPWPAPLMWAYAFALTGIVSLLINLSDPNVALLGSKNYFEMWGLFLGVVLAALGGIFRQAIARRARSDRVDPTAVRRA